MSGRFTQHYTWAEVHAFLSVLGPPRNLQPHYNIAPTRTIDVIRLTRIHQMNWAGRTEDRGNAGETAGSFFHPPGPSEFGYLIQRKGLILQSKLAPGAD